MDKLIVIKYKELKWTSKLYIRYICLPYTDHDNIRVKEYVEELNEIVNVDNDKFDVTFKIIEGDENVQNYLKKIKSKAVISVIGYKEICSAKIYRQSELLPHEADMCNVKQLQWHVRLMLILNEILGHFGGHGKDADIIGENI